MHLEIVALVVFAILLVVFSTIYFFGGKIKSKLSKGKKEEKKPEEKPKEEKKDKPSVTGKVERPILLSPTPEQKKLDAPSVKTSEKRTVSRSDIDEIRKFIEDNADGPRRLMRPSNMNVRQSLSDYNKVEDFGEVIDIDEEDFSQSSSQTSSYEPYGGRHSSGESEFLKNRGSDKKLYDELKNMSPEMKKIIMADILRRKDN